VREPKRFILFLFSALAFAHKSHKAEKNRRRVDEEELFSLSQDRFLGLCNKSKFLFCFSLNYEQMILQKSIQ
jgi:hypothetical protein